MSEQNPTEVSVRSIVTLEQVQSYLAMTPGKTDEQARLVKWIDEVSGDIEARLRRKVRAQNVTRIVNGSGCNYIPLVPYPIIGLQETGEGDEKTVLSSLQVCGSDGTGDWENLLDDADLIFYDRLGKEPWKLSLLGGNIFPGGEKNVKVQWIAGWPSDDLPGDVVTMCLEMVAMKHEESKHGSGRLGKTTANKSIGGGSTSTSYDDLFQRWERIINKNRIMGVE